MFFAVAALSIALDMYTKRLVETAMTLGETRTVIPGLLDLHFLQNKVDFLLVFTGILLAGIAVYYSRTRKKAPLVERLCLSLIFGGGCGNFISRAVVGCVTDFLDIHIIPVFNVADICVTGGCILLLIYYFFFEGKKSGAAEAPEGTDDGRQQ